MNKPSYIFAIIFLSMVIIGGMIHSWVWFRMGPEMVYLQSYLNWFSFGSVAAVVADAFVLYYFYTRRWKFVFIAGIIVMVLLILQDVLEYTRLVNAQLSPDSYHSVIRIIYFIFSVVIGVAITLAARHEKILKWSGILIALTGFLYLILAFYNFFGLTPQFVMSAFMWVSFLSNSIYVFFILVFVREMKKLTFGDRPSWTHQGLYVVTTIGALFLIVLLFSTGMQLAIETRSSLNWKKIRPAASRKLAERFEDRVFVSSRGDTLHYFLMKPVNYDTVQSYPLVTCLHGGAIGTGDIEIHEPAPFLSLPENHKKYPAFIFVPQVRVGYTWGWLPGFPGMDSLVFEAITALELEFSIDDRRLYITGPSGGGYGTWHYITTHPNTFAAAIPMSGIGNPQLAKDIIHIPVWAFHGDLDRNVPVSGSRNMINAMRKAGGDPRYSEFQGVAHNVWPEIVKTPGVFEWLFAQKRQ